jgi:alanyl-tRNA synthetase
MPTSQEIRRQFIDFFVARHGHRFVPSSPVVPLDDPTLLFANAGMNQFKPYFLGTQKPPAPRAANTQKCIRAGGKHNDLEDVGKDTYHHTFFEMLGNWSFGDYFKKEAIAWAWDLLVGQWKLDPTRLHATYFQGDAAEGLAADTEARDLWRQYLPAERVHPGNKKDNFWEMGETGPCGPCSEIHIDRTADKSGGTLVNAGDARVMEIWNLVFIQFNRDSAGKLTPLPAKHVDTGMGFERICSVIQGKSSNYDTDVFTPIFAAIQNVTQARAYSGKLDDPVDIAYRVVADHIRTLTFALTDGAEVTNEGRGYVLRRILRRAVRHGRQTLGVREPFFYKLVPAVVDAMGEAFPELTKNPQGVAQRIREEEESFGRTIDRGIALFEEAARDAMQTAQRRAKEGLAAPAMILAEDAFKLYDTFGFPLDLTQVMAEERGMTVDVAGFERLMEQQRRQSRSGSGGEDREDVTPALVAIVQRDNPPATRFLGYEKLDGQAKLLGYYAFASCECLVLDQTPFYAESGGQVGDTGVITGANGARFAVTDTQKLGDVYFHIGETEAGNFTPGTPVGPSVDAARRKRIMANHTATHVLNHKLRGVLGDHVQQKGSLVDDTKTRFDFAHGAALTDEQIETVETLVVEDVKKDLPVYAHVAPQEQALKVHGLRAVFGEKYPPNVRVIAVGQQPQMLLADPARKEWYDYSVEFCGGTHVPSTGAIGDFALVSEEAVGKGVRRLIGVTGQAAREARKWAGEVLDQTQGEGDPAAALAQLNEALASGRLPLLAKAKLQQRMAELQKLVKDADKAKAKESAGAAVEWARRVADEAQGSVLVAEYPGPGTDADALRTAMDVIRKKKPDAALLLGAVTGPDKVAFVAAVPAALIQKGLKAGDWVREVAKAAGGGGGGRPDMAQAGGKDPAKLAQALDAGRKFAAAKL